MIHLSALIAATALLLVLILFAVFNLRQNSIRRQAVIINAECISTEKRDRLHTLLLINMK